MFKKTIFVFYAFFVLFGFSSVNTYAAETPFPPPQPSNPDSSYEYMAAYYKRSKNSELAYTIYYVYSKTPIKYTEIKNSGSTISSYFVVDSDSFYFYNSCTTYVDKSQHCSLSQNFPVSGGKVIVGKPQGSDSVNNYGILIANHDVYDQNGKLVFQRPFLTAEALNPVVETVQEGIPMVVGGTICLVVLGISLILLLRFFRGFSMG